MAHADLAIRVPINRDFANAVDFLNECMELDSTVALVLSQVQVTFGRGADGAGDAAAASTGGKE